MSAASAQGRARSGPAFVGFARQSRQRRQTTRFACNGSWFYVTFISPGLCCPQMRSSSRNQYIVTNTYTSTHKTLALANPTCIYVTRHERAATLQARRPPQRPPIKDRVRTTAAGPHKSLEELLPMPMPKLDVRRHALSIAWTRPCKERSGGKTGAQSTAGTRRHSAATA